MSRKWPLAATAVVVGLAGAAAYFQLQSKRIAVKPAAASAPLQPVGKSVEITLPGKVVARELVRVPVPVDGRILTFHAEVGADVYEGQLLAEIRNETLTNAQETAATELDQIQERVNGLESGIAAARLEVSRSSADAARARGELDRAGRLFERQRMLLNQGATPRLVKERAEREYLGLEQESKSAAEVAKAAEERLSSLLAALDNARRQLRLKGEDLESAQARVELGQVFSPVSGVVAARKGAPGDEVHPAMDELFQIATNLSNLRIIVEPSAAQMQQIRPGQAALISTADVPNESLGGIVSSAADGKVTVEFANPSALVRPGHTAQVRIRLT